MVINVIKKLSFIILLLFLIFILNSSKQETVLVYNEVSNEHEYQQIYLQFEDNTLNTNNFDLYFTDIDVLKIYPYINPVYAGKLKANYSYTFTRDRHNLDLERFKTNFIESIRKIGLNQEANILETKGVIINKVLVYDRIETLKSKFGNYSYIKYSKNFNAIYYKF